MNTPTTFVTALQAIPADAVPPITEDDIAHFLVNTPDFFERHAELLATVHLSSPHGNRAVSLQERQAEMLRDKIKGLEQRIMEMVRHGNENAIIADKLQRWTRELLLTTHAHQLPQRVVDEVQKQFLIPQAAIKVWGVNGIFSQYPFAMGVSEDAQTFASSLTLPYCGVNSGFEAATWLEDAALAQSLALIPLRPGSAMTAAPAFGLLVLASPDPQRFNTGMGTEFLERVGQVASAALSRLRPM
jgi:uncharacterized protein